MVIFSYNADVEIGSRKTYENFIDDVKIWISRTKYVKTMILIKVEKNWRYYFSIRKIEYAEFGDLEFSKTQRSETSMVILVYWSNSFGPRQIDSLIWMSKMAVFCEI